MVKDTLRKLDPLQIIAAGMIVISMSVMFSVGSFFALRSILEGNRCLTVKIDYYTSGEGAKKSRENFNLYVKGQLRELPDQEPPKNLCHKKEGN